MGRRATAGHDGSFVFADSVNSSFSSSAADGFFVRASGGTYVYSDSGATTGTYLAAGSGSWESVRYK